MSSKNIAPRLPDSLKVSRNDLEQIWETSFVHYFSLIFYEKMVQSKTLNATSTSPESIDLRFGICNLN